MTPGDQGYVRCARCGTWRRADGLRVTQVRLLDNGVTSICVDEAWCGRQAGVGKGELTGGAP
jgi:hypothetical protein